MRVAAVSLCNGTDAVKIAAAESHLLVQLLRPLGVEAVCNEILHISLPACIETTSKLCKAVRSLRELQPHSHYTPAASAHACDHIGAVPGPLLGRHTIVNSPDVKGSVAHLRLSKGASLNQPDKKSSIPKMPPNFRSLSSTTGLKAGSICASKTLILLVYPCLHGATHHS